jgi:hypothetical protein
MTDTDGAQRLYTQQRDAIVARAVAYYQEYVKHARERGWWVRFRPAHERWLIGNFGEEVAQSIMERVRGWWNT